jgi:hypothetical protein
MAGGKRPFWMHQLVEYILGIALVASGAQSPTPAVPAVLGGIILLNAALTKGALGAFRAYGRATHRLLDPIVMLVCIAGAVQRWITVELSTRAVVLAIVAVHFVVFIGSSFYERPPKGARVKPAGDRSTELGKSAGRVVGSGVKTARKMFSGDGK